jgi:hypothetical protein
MIAYNNDDRRADGVQRVTGRPAMSVREFVSLYAEKFGGELIEPRRPVGGAKPPPPTTGRPR